jgi:hypothetical protein
MPQHVNSVGETKPGSINNKESEKLLGLIQFIVAELTMIEKLIHLLV